MMAQTIHHADTASRRRSIEASIRMRESTVLALASFAFLSSCATTPKADYLRSEPVVAILDVSPGYKRALSLSIPDNKIIELRVVLISQNPSRKWMPTAFIALNNDDSDITYGLNLTTDIKLQKQYVRARVIDMKEKKELTNHTHQQLLSISSENTLKIEISGQGIRSFINNTLVEERQLPFEPTYYDIGASSGSYKLTVIEQPPPPAPE